MACKKYFGKFRGTVLNNEDLVEKRGRLILQVPDVLGMSPSNWAMPCLPLAGVQMGTYLVPPIGAGVWVEFEKGDPNLPIWTGCWWGTPLEVPSVAHLATPASPNMVFQTQLQNSIVISDVPLIGITLRSRSGAQITVNDAGVTISSGVPGGALITLNGPTVTVNGGALTVI